MATLNNYSEIGDFNKLEKIGEGTYGIVYKAEDKRTGEIVAIKKIRLGITEEGIPSTSLREISVLKEISIHPNVVKLIEILKPHKGKLYLIFEFMLMDLRKYMDRVKRPLDPMLIVSYTYQVLRALDFCHSRRIVHRDLKPQNLLIDSAGLIKLADFGLARAVGVPVRVYTHEVVTMWYRCPEVLLGIRRYSYQVDVWSVGCIFGEMLTKTPLFRGDSEIDQLFSIFRIMGTPTSEEWPELDTLPDFKPTFPMWSCVDLMEFMPNADYIAIDLFKRLLVYNPVKRLNSKMALHHPYFRNFDPQLLPPAPPNYAVAFGQSMELDPEFDMEYNALDDQELAPLDLDNPDVSESFPIYNDEQDIQADSVTDR